MGYSAAAVNQTLIGKAPSVLVICSIHVLKAKENMTGVPVVSPDLPDTFKQFSRVTVVLEDAKEAVALVVFSCLCSLIRMAQAQT